MSAFIVALLAQGLATNDVQFQRENAARTAYAACLFRENDRRRDAGLSSLDDFGRSCKVERDEIAQLDREVGRSADVIEAGLKGIDETLRESIERMNRFYPAKSALRN